MSRSYYVDAHIFSKAYDDDDSDYDSDYDQDNDPDFLRKLNEYVKENLKPTRGDIIDTVFEEHRYRNEGKYIFDGKNVIKLDYDVDDYGAVPPEFQDFAIGWWKDTIDHNNIQYLSTKFFRSLNFTKNSDIWTARSSFRHFKDNIILEKMTTFIIDERNLESIDGDYCRFELMAFNVPNYSNDGLDVVFLQKTS